jgi:hypothetical protein
MMIKATLLSNSANLTVQNLGGDKEPIYSLDQRSLWHWSVVASRPGSYFLLLVITLVDPRAEVAVTAQKFIVRIVVTKKNVNLGSLLRNAGKGANWLVGAIGVLGIGTFLVERLLLTRSPVRSSGATSGSAGGVDPG